MAGGGESREYTKEQKEGEQCRQEELSKEKASTILRKTYQT